MSSKPGAVQLQTPVAVMPAEGGVTGRDFRKRDEEKFARHIG